MMKSLWVFICLPILGLSQDIQVYDWPTKENEAILSTYYSVEIQSNGKTLNSQVICSPAKEVEIPNFASQFRGGRSFNWSIFSYDFKEPLEISVTKLFGTGADEVEVVPSSFEIPSITSSDGRTVTFSLNKPRYVSIHFKSEDNKHTSDGVIKHMFMLFADSLETSVPDITAGDVHVYSSQSTLEQLQAARVIYFPKGYHDLTKNLPDIGNLGPAIERDGKEVYLAGGAYLSGRIHGVPYNKVKIYGRGVLSGMKFKWSKNLNNNGGTLGVDSFESNEAAVEIGTGGKGYNICEGILVCDGPSHGVNLGHHATYRNVKLWGWHPNNDGFRPWGEGNLIEKCFLRPCDDALYNKGLTVKETVFWPGYNGSILTFGWSGLYNSENSYFENNYVIYPEWRRIGNNHGVLMSQVDYDMVGTNVTFKNLYIDGNIPALTNLHTNSDKAKANDYALPTDGPARVGEISGILFDGIYVKGDKIQFTGNGFEQSPSNAKSLIQGAKLTNGDTYFIRNVKFKDVYFRDQCLTNDNVGRYFDIDASTTSNIQFVGCGACTAINPKILSVKNSGAPSFNDSLSVEEFERVNIYASDLDVGAVLTWTLPSGEIVTTDFRGLQNLEQTGEYILNYRTEDGCKGRLTFNLTIQKPAILSLEEAPSAQIFPVPSLDWIEMNKKEKGTIFNLQGIPVKEIKSWPVFIGDLPVGTYLLKTKSSITKIVIL